MFIDIIVTGDPILKNKNRQNIEKTKKDIKLEVRIGLSSLLDIRNSLVILFADKKKVETKINANKEMLSL